MLILYGQQINMFGQVETSQTGGQQYSEVNNLWLHTLCISISIFAMQSHTKGHLPYQRPPTISKTTYYTKGHLLYQRPPTISKTTYYTKDHLLYQRPPTIPKATYYTKDHLLYQRPPTIPKATPKRS